MSGKKINGKKIRSSVFYNILSLIAAVIFLSFLLAAVLPSNYMIMVQIMAPIVLIFLCFALLSFRNVLCIFSDDRLYYLLPRNSGMEFIVISGNRRTVSSKAGSILYSDIQRYEYLSPKLTWNYFFPSGVIIHGSDFDLKISGVGKRFIKQLENAKRSCVAHNNAEIDAAGTPDTQIQIAHHVRNGLWKEIWQSFENGSLEDVFHGYKILRMESDERVDTIDIFTQKNGHEIDFHMDDCSIYMSAPDNDTEQMIFYKHISKFGVLLSVIREFLVSNS